MTSGERRGETIAAQAGHFIDSANGSVMPPIQPSVTFAREAGYALIDPAFNYGRGNNPTTAAAWLLIRGLRTLYRRVRRASESTQAIAHHFEGHEKLDALLYPGLASRPGHAIAARQMTGGFGGMLSVLVAGGRAAALRAWWNTAPPSNGRRAMCQRTCSGSRSASKMCAS